MERLMNFISIILYLGNVVDKLVPVTAVALIFTVVFCGVMSMYLADVGHHEDNVGVVKLRNKLLWAIPVLLIIFTLSPSSDTLYLIAASELGEEVVTNPEVVEVATELKDIILDKIRAVGE
jgi:heme/copper-type cytochrome/quinol oxidase subunit 2